MKSLPTARVLAFAVAASSALAASLAPAVQYQNPVRAGDYPDPSVIRVGNDYWATATSSEWAPHFPILHSRDLVNWEVKGHVFESMPAWTKANFWAPEIAEDKGKFFIYYTARSVEQNRLAVAVATADRPQGPWTDHGPLVSQDAGSIDPVPFTDAKGVRWLVWKEDGNSKKQPTPLWLQRLSDDGLKLVGERREVLRNDAPWEGAVVEGPFIVRRGEYYYLFYSGNACCGRGCNYALGVARAKEMTGPWEKAPGNPILAGNDTWRCPGHGSIVTDAEGRYWLLYHAYAQKGFVATGREMLLDEVVFGANGWPTINGGKGASTRTAGPKNAAPQKDITALRDDFSGQGFGPGWQWLVGRKPAAQMKQGYLTLQASDGPASTVQSITVPSFVAETAVDLKALAAGASAGLVIYGDRANHLALLTDGKTVQVWSEQKGQRNKVAQTEAQGGAAIRLRIACVDGNRFRFAIQGAGGKWTELAGETDGSFLPPWDRGVRTGVYVAGQPGASASFDYFTATPGDDKLFAQ
jgi:xylan 1,4-beta-xylosidase